MKRILTAFAALVLAACGAGKRYVISDGAAIGTTFHICAELGGGASAADIYSAMKEVEREARASMSIFDEGSLLNRINRGETDSIDEHIARNFAIARTVGELSGGRYDITVKPLTEAWGFAAREGDERPNLDSLLRLVGADKWHVEGGRVVKADPRVQFDLNSVAKGYTVDMAAQRLEAMGAENYIVEIGGEVRCRGVNPSGELWRIGIDTPFEGNMSPGASMSGAVVLNDRALATSGNYRRFHTTADGRKIVHTIDPRTGEGAVSRLLSATVTAATCAEADALATMFLVLGDGEACRMASEMRDTVGVFFILAGEGDEYEFFNTLDK